MIVQIPITLQHFEPDFSTDFEHKLRVIFLGVRNFEFLYLGIFYIHKPTPLPSWSMGHLLRHITGPNQGFAFKKCLQDHQKDKNIFPRFIIYCVLSKGHFLRVDSFSLHPPKKNTKTEPIIYSKSSGENLSFFVGEKPHSGWQENLVACDGAWRLQPGKRFMQKWPHSEANQSILAMVFLHWRCFFQEGSKRISMSFIKLKIFLV